MLPRNLGFDSGQEKYSFIFFKASRSAVKPC